MSIENLLRDEIAIVTGQRKWKENPLITVGLGEAILRVTANDEDLFAAIRQYIKQLTRAIHPDIRKDVPAEMVAKNETIREAFELLKSDENLQEAFTEFKQLRSYETSDVISLRARVAALETNNGRLAERNAELEEQRLEVEQLKTTLERQLRKTQLAEALASNTAPALEEAAEEAESRRNQWYKLFKRRTKTLDGVIRSVRQLEMFIAAERWVFRPIGVTRPLPPRKVSEVGVLVFEIRQKKKSDGDLVPEAFPEDPEERAIYDRCKAMLESQFTPHMKESWSLECRFERIPVNRGAITTIVSYKIEKEVLLGKRTEVLVGSLSLEESLKESVHDLEKLPDRAVFKNLAPFLFPGRVLVAMRTNYAPQGSAERKITEDEILSDLQRYRIHEGGSRKRLFKTQRIIVSVK